MKPIYQTVFGYPQGNCQAACLATIMGVPLSDIPDDPEVAWTDRNEMHAQWLRNLGFYMLTFLSGEEYVPIPGVVIWSVPSQKYDCLHAVVAYNGRIVHDPREDNEPYPADTKPKEVTVIIPLDPAEWQYRRLA